MPVFGAPHCAVHTLPMLQSGAQPLGPEVLTARKARRPRPVPDGAAAVTTISAGTVIPAEVRDGQGISAWMDIHLAIALHFSGVRPVLICQHCHGCRHGLPSTVQSNHLWLWSCWSTASQRHVMWRRAGGQQTADCCSDSHQSPQPYTQC